MKINSNITALMTMTYMNKATDRASTAVNRVSSGLKINKASDSPASWAIANQLLGQSDGLKQANRNSMDAISLVQTTEGALDEVNAMLNRIRELCVEAVNDSNTLADRQSMQDEIDQLIEEVNNITNRTDFNGVKILNNKEDITIQTGANAYEMLELSGEVTSMSYVLNMLVDFDVMKAKDNEMMLELKNLVSEENSIDESKIDFISLIMKNEDIDDATKITQIHEYIHPEQKVDEKGQPILITTVDENINNLIVKIENTIYPRNDPNDPHPVPTANATGKLKEIQESIDDYKAQRFENLKQEVTNIRDKYATDETLITESLVKDVTESLKRADEDYQGNGKISDVDSFLEELTKIIQKEEVNEEDVLENAINKVDLCVTHVTNIRSMLGAYQNRLESIISNLGVSEENITEALSRIQDADMAEEITEYTLQNVIAQAGISMLSQANQRPQQILQLLAQ